MSAEDVPAGREPDVATGEAAVAEAAGPEPEPPGDAQPSRRAVVIGASSGIGRELARRLAAEGWELGLAARREPLLRELAAELPTRSAIRPMDVTRAEEAVERLDELVAVLGGMDLIVLNAGVGYSRPSWEEERRTIETNVLGFTALARRSMEYFLERGSGHIVGVTSISGLRGIGEAAAYSASKAYMSRYLESLRLRADARGADITVTDVIPGFVETPMTERRKDMFWVAPVDEAVEQIYRAIRNRKRRAYITRRWRLIAWFVRLVPYPLLAAMARRSAGSG